MSRILDQNWIDSYVQLTRNSEPPILFRKWAAVSVVASALRRKCMLEWGTLTFYPNMYIVLVAPAGAARKGTALALGLDLILDIDVQVAAEATTRERLIERLEQANDSTVNPRTGEVVSHSSMTIHSQELTVFLGYHNHQLMSDLTDWYDCRKVWTYETKHQGINEIRGVWVNLIGATTPQLIRSSMPMDAIGSGLTSRMIFVYERRKGKTEIAPFYTDEDLVLLEKIHHDLHEIKILQGKFIYTDDFVDLWAQWYPAQDNNPPFNDDRFAGYFERRPAHVMKLSMILNASRTNSMIVNAMDMKNAIALIEATEHKMPQTFAGFGKASYSDVLARVMARVGMAKSVIFGDIVYEFRDDADANTMKAIAEAMETMGFVDIVPGVEGKYGRDAKITYRPKLSAGSYVH